MGRMTSHILGKIKAMFETTNQIYNAYPLVNIQKDTKRLQNIYINYQWAIVYSYVSLPEGMYRSCCMSMLMLCNLFKTKSSQDLVLQHKTVVFTFVYPQIYVSEKLQSDSDSNHLSC